MVKFVKSDGGSKNTSLRNIFKNIITKESYKNDLYRFCFPEFVSLNLDAVMQILETDVNENFND